MGQFLFLNMGGGEIFMVLLVVLLLFGGKGVPGIARTLGKSIREFKDAASGIQRDFQNSANQIHQELSSPPRTVKEEPQEAGHQEDKK